MPTELDHGAEIAKLHQAIGVLFREVGEVRSAVEQGRDTSSLRAAMDVILQQVESAMNALKENQRSVLTVIADLHDEFTAYKKIIDAKVQELIDSNRALGQCNANLKADLRTAKTAKKDIK